MMLPPTVSRSRAIRGFSELSVDDPAWHRRRTPKAYWRDELIVLLAVVVAGALVFVVPGDMFVRLPLAMGSLVAVYLYAKSTSKPMPRQLARTLHLVDLNALTTTELERLHDLVWEYANLTQIRGAKDGPVLDDARLGRRHRAVADEIVAITAPHHRYVPEPPATMPKPVAPQIPTTVRAPQLGDNR